MRIAFRPKVSVTPSQAWMDACGKAVRASEHGRLCRQSQFGSMLANVDRSNKWATLLCWGSSEVLLQDVSQVKEAKPD